MAGAFAIVCLVEWLAGREQSAFVRAAAPASAHPVVEAQRAEDTDEHDSLGWTAFEEAQEPSDAMTIIGALPKDEGGVAEVEAEADPDPDPEPESDEPELPPAAEVDAESGPSAASRGWWRRRHEDDDPAASIEPPRHVRVLPAVDEPVRADPWEEGFDDAEVAGESDEPALARDDAPRRFRRR
jgi:hypothetical protein